MNNVKTVKEKLLSLQNRHVNNTQTDQMTRCRLCSCTDCLWLFHTLSLLAPSYNQQTRPWNLPIIHSN